MAAALRVFLPTPEKNPPISDGFKSERDQQESSFGYPIPTLPNWRSSGKQTQRTEDLSHTDVILELFLFLLQNMLREH